ncbi:tyrosine-type recombinase/integrase [Fructobacillus fructosus]|uniref:tyrosine-type recombinase/integrase n=1 Tax=Fructobacillus fructosus TaxID=1631 RepID=UPI0016589AB6|nr:site-specific integrase [Fructobacillus fructosus]MBC9118620.1 site-specific integrase [Fructobacillus fructosus]MBD9365097.1 site-specific integrase [Leuconostoc mesenteroides]
MQIKELNTKDGKIWEVTGYLGKHSDGTRARAKKRGFPSKKIASDWFNNERVLFKAGNSRYNKKELPNVLTVGELYEMWLETYQYTVQESTLSHAISIFDNYILPDWGSVLVTDIKPLPLQKYINSMQSKLVYYRKNVGYLRKILDLAVKLKMIKDNPFKFVDLPKAKRAPAVKQYLDQDEFKSFIFVLDNEYRFVNQQAFTCLRLAALTGMRTGEILGLQWKHINFNVGTIKIEQALGRGLHGKTYIKAPKSESSNRKITIDASMVHYLAEWFDATSRKNENDFVFNIDGKPMHYLRPNKWLHDVEDTYNVANGISLHKLRHTWATLALEQGASIKQVQTYLGHADASITLNIYSGITDKAKQETGNILTSLIEEKDSKITHKITQISESPVIPTDK